MIHLTVCERPCTRLPGDDCRGAAHASPIQVQVQVLAMQFLSVFGAPCCVSRACWQLSLLSLTSFDRIILLDNDCFVLKNIDHLVGVPTPAFVFMTGQLNSGVAVLSPSSTDHTRLHALIRHESYLDVNDRPLMHQRGQQVRHSYMSDQLVWQNLYSPAGFYELPTLYNALPGAMQSAVTRATRFRRHIVSPSAYLTAKVANSLTASRLCMCRHEHHESRMEVRCRHHAR